jgi:hypothetical protein
MRTTHPPNKPPNTADAIQSGVPTYHGKHDATGQHDSRSVATFGHVSTRDKATRPQNPAAKNPTSTNRAASAARALLSVGLAVVPVLPRAKKCVVTGWPDLRITPSTVGQHFRDPDGNVGVLWGAASGGIVDVDLDHPLALEHADKFLPPTGATWGRPSKPRSHRLYRIADGPMASTKFDGLDKQRLVDLQSDGRMSVAPGSIHASGEHVNWDVGADGALGSIGVVEGEELLEAIERLVEHVRAIQRATLYTDTKDPENPKTQTPKDPKALIPKDPSKSDTHSLREMDDERIWGIIDDFVVTGHGQHDSASFTLARFLKLDARIATLEGARGFFDAWWARSKPHCQEQDDDLAWAKFADGWDRAVIAVVSGGVAARVLADLASVPKYLNRHDYNERTSSVLAAIAEMARRQPTEPFALANDQIARAFGMTSQNAGLLLDTFARNGYIVIVDRGKRSDIRALRRAKRVRWNGDP